MLTARSRTRAFEPVLTMTAVISDFLSDCFFCIRAEELTTIVNKEGGKRGRGVTYAFAAAFFTICAVG